MQHSDIEILLDASVRLARMETALKEVTRALRDTVAENDLLREELQLANLKLQRMRLPLRVVPSDLPALLRPQAE